MENPRLEQSPPLDTQSPPHTLSPCSSGRRRRSSASNSPEFEFWMIRNPSFPQTNLLSADELFSDGVILPLHLLPHHHHHHPPDPPPPYPDPISELPSSEPDSSSILLTNSLSSTTPTLSTSKRWKDIFKKSSSFNKDDKEKEKEKKKERKNGSGGGSSSAELNINIWPFSRSRSAGNGGSRPRMSTATRKVSSAPCSRSNSAGESKSRKWPSSPSRGGVHLARSSPVWQVRRPEKGGKKDGNETRRCKATVAGGGSGTGVTGGAKGKVLNINVPMCIGYRHHLSCRSDENSAIGVPGPANGGGDGGGGQSGGGGDGGRGSNLFNLRSLFAKKVY